MEFKLHIIGRSHDARPTLLVLTVLCACLLMCRSVQAQIVNVLGDVDAAREGFHAHAEVPLEWRSGNTDLLRFGASGLASYRTGRHLIFLELSSDYGAEGEPGTADREVFLARTFEHLRYRHAFRAPLSVETYLQHGVDRVKRQALRALGGGGLRIQAERSWGLVAFGSAYMLDYTQVEVSSAPSEAISTLEQRWSNYLELSYALQKQVTFTHTTFVQPSFNDFTNILLSSTSALVLHAGHFYVKAGLTFTYDNLPPFAVDQHDVVLTSTLGFQL